MASKNIDFVDKYWKYLKLVAGFTFNSFSLRLARNTFNIWKKEKKKEWSKYYKPSNTNQFKIKELLHCFYTFSRFFPN